MYKKLLVLAGTKLVARLPASDFPSENPRSQTRNFPYTNTFVSMHLYERIAGELQPMPLKKAFTMEVVSVF